MKRYLVAALAAAALFAPAAIAQAVVLNWQSPTGNIHCRYSSINNDVACQTLNDGFVGTIRLYGRAIGDASINGRIAGGVTLPYGRQYTIRNFRCQSLRSGMRCFSLRSGFGFLINRDQFIRFRL